MRRISSFFLIVLFFSWGETLSQSKKADFWPATLLENARGLEKGAWTLASGIEFEEDSGDFPTTKIPLLFQHGLTDDLTLTGSAQLVRFNLGDYTAWGGAESILGIKYLAFRGSGTRPNVQFKSEMFLPSGGMGAVHFGASAGANLSWACGDWGLHMNGKYAAVSENEKQLGVSEIDRWRVAAGIDYLFPSSGWNWVFAFVGARPVRTKPNEWSLEISNRLPLSKHWAFSSAGAGGLRTKGIDWLYRFMVDYRF